MKRNILKEINPEVLKNLRERLGFSVEEIAKKLKTTSEKIIKVEEGKEFLTSAQLKKLSDIYQISLAAFFGDTTPYIPALSDFRLNREKKLNPEVFLAQKRAFYLTQEIAALSEKKSKIPSFNTDNPVELAHRFRSFLNVQVIKNKPPKEILKEYKSIIEEKLFVPVIEYPLKVNDVRAFSILSDIAAIVLNEEDQPQVKIFSLFHELGHLLRKNSGICSIDLEVEGEKEVETFCNKFAAEFLVPEDDLRDEIKSRGFASFNDEIISELSKIYGVSKQVIMLRLLWLGYIRSDDYKEFKTKYLEPKKGKSFGRRNWDEVFFNRTGGLVIKEIRKAYKRGDITFADVINSLELKTKYAEKFIEG